MTETFLIRVLAVNALVWGAVFICSTTGLIEALTAHSLLRDGNDNLGAGLFFLIAAAIFFFGEESAIAKFRLGREHMEWWEPLPLCVGLNIVAAIWFVDSLGIAVPGA